uniref:protein-tyrosine-phosphatase n=1 Tax=Platynereis dumerilii TaxID=6359 RepID=A0A2H5BFF5_PLADU|nr:contactin [Platynereis dumerilii]
MHDLLFHAGKLGHRHIPDKGCTGSIMGLKSRGFILLLNLVYASAQYDCPPPWLPLEDKCYKFQMYPAMLPDAEAACGKDGATLISIESASQHQFVKDWLSVNEVGSDKDRKWFTSGRKEVTSQTNEVRFFWEGNGQEIEGAQFWLKDEDRMNPGDHILYYTDGINWGWQVGEVTKAQPYICEINKAEIYKIIDAERGLDYGIAETNIAALQKGPVVVRQPRDFIYDTKSVKQYVDLECIADGNPQVAYSWFTRRDGSMMMIDPMVESRYTLINGKLIIHDPEDTQDNGDYQCKMENSIGSILSNIVQLSFGYLLDFSKAVRKPIIVDAHEGTGLPCNAPKHYPEILYSWYRNNIMNFVRPELKPYTFISNNGKLYFSSVTKDDEGEYYCMVLSPRAGVSSSEGKVSMPIRLSVREAIASIREPQIENGFPMVFPSSPKKGDNVRIECFAMGYSDLGNLQYQWTKEGSRIPPQAKIIDHGRVLNIPKVQIADSGTYRCKVTRVNGQSDEATVVLPVDATPYFTIPLKDQIVDLDGTVSLRCVADGIPSVDYKWLKNSEILTQNSLTPEDKERFTISNNVLTIRNVNDKDNGMYQCAAANLHGSRYSSAQLRVLSLAPTFAKYPLHRTTFATIGGNATIICRPEAAPRADIQWKKNGRPQSYSTNPSDRVHMLPNGNLHFTAATRSDRGNYTCIATNSLGEAESQGELEVLATTSITQFPRRTVVHVNRTGFMPCEASHNPLLDVSYLWYHNNRMIDFLKVKYDGAQYSIISEPHFARGEGINRGGLYIMDAKFYHAGDYTCVVQTSSSTQSRTALLQVIGPPGEPPGIVGLKVTTTTITLSWGVGADNGRPITAYTIEGYNEDEKIWREFKTNIVGKEKDDRNTTVTGLSPFSNYRFRVRAINVLGIGKASLPSTMYTTLAAPPLEIPHNVGGGGGKVGDLVITWDPLPKWHQNGKDVGYKVYYKEKFLIDDQWTENIVKGNSRNRYVALVGSNKFYTQYDVMVRAFNERGDGPPSEIVTIWSAEDIPIGVPTNVRIEQYNATALMVTWNPVPDTIEQIKGVLKGYRINYWKEETEDEGMAIYRPLSGQRDHGLIIGLDVKTYYLVNVQVFNSAGNGPKSEDYVEETLRSAPMNQPTEVHVEVHGDNSIHVRWRGVSTSIFEEPLEGYKVRYWKNGESRYVAHDVNAEKKTNIRLKGLEQNILYNLRVFGYSRGGEGLSSSPTVQFILGPSCRILENNPERRFEYACDGCSLQISTLLLSLLLCVHFLWHQLH